MKMLEDLTKEQLIDDLIVLRRRISELETIEKDKNKSEEELNRVRAMFEGLFEFAPDAILVVNPEGHIIRVNKQTERLFGYSRGELVDAPLEILLPERFREIHKEHRRKYLTEPHVRPMGRELELYGRRKDSSEFHVDIALGPLQVEQDLFVLAVVRDFTQFKKSEAGRLREKSISDATIDNMPGIFYLLDEQGKLLRWNKNLEQASGYSALEISKMHFLDFFLGQNKETMAQTIAAFTNGQTDVEADLTSKDGSQTAYFFTGSQIDIARAHCLVGIGIDITERKRAEVEIRELSQRLSYHVENSPLAVIEWGPDMRLIRWLGEAERIFGWRAEDIIGKRIEDFRWIYEDDESQVAEIFSELKSGSNLQHFSANRNYRKDGSVIHCEWYNSSLQDDSGKLRSILSLVLDVTERKQMEEELRKSRDELERRVQVRTTELELANEKLHLVPSRLIAVQENERKRLAGDLHDSIGQTLAALKFRIEHVITTLEKREPMQALQFLHDFVPVLQRSIDETRAIYMGLKPTMLADHGILATLEWYRLELLKLYPDQHIELETTIGEEDIPEDLKIALFRIVQEALNNTSKHGKSEWVDVRLAKNDGAIELEISDDGIGMDLDYIIKSSTAKSLGLIGMKERTEITGGTFTIKSAPNEGTTVKAVWPNHSNIPTRRPPYGY